MFKASGFEIGEFVHFSTSHDYDEKGWMWGVGHVVEVLEGDKLVVGIQYCSRQWMMTQKATLDVADCQVVCPHCHYVYCECDEYNDGMPDLPECNLDDYYNQPL